MIYCEGKGEESNTRIAATFKTIKAARAWAKDVIERTPWKHVTMYRMTKINDAEVNQNV